MAEVYPTSRFYPQFLLTPRGLEFLPYFEIVKPTFQKHEFESLLRRHPVATPAEIFLLAILASRSEVIHISKKK